MNDNSLGGLLQHVVSVPPGNGNEGDGFGVVSNLFDEVGGFLDNFVETVLAPLQSVVSPSSIVTYVGCRTLVVSILLTATISCLTPRVKASKACSRVWPSLEIPASNSPVPAAMMRIAQSAWEVPVIMFLMKSRCPGASMTLRIFGKHSTANPNQSEKEETYGNHVLGGLELPKGNVDGDTTLTLSLEFVQDPG